MRRGLLLALVTLVVTAAAFSAPPRERTVTLRATVRELAADGTRAAMLLGSPRSCSIRLWDARTGARVVIGERCFGSPREGTHGLAVGGSRAAWILTGGGNFLETQMRTATVTRPKPASLAFMGALDGEFGDFVGDPLSDGRSFFFRIWRVCSTNEFTGYLCPPGRQSGDVERSQIWRYRPGASGRCPTDSPALAGCTQIASFNSDVELLAAAEGRVALRPESGPIELRNASGRRLRTFPAATRPTDAALSGSRLVTRRGASLQVFDTSTGAHLRTWPVRAGSRLVDADGGLAVLVSGRTIHLVRLANGAAARIRVPGTRSVKAQLEPTGLFSSSGRRVAFTPRRQVLRRFR